MFNNDVQPVRVMIGGAKRGREKEGNKSGRPAERNNVVTTTAIAVAVVHEEFLTNKRLFACAALSHLGSAFTTVIPRCTSLVRCSRYYVRTTVCASI